ncbi:MAG: DUF92 domain-containing protein [Thermococci archaeon]|nr:DUF92 domain-containing protein [Thermococci archaeon]
MVAVTAGIIFGSLVALMMGVCAYKSRALDLKGSVSGVLLGVLLLYLGGLYPFLAMALFVLLGVVATKYRFEYKLSRGLSSSGEDVRGAGNVWGNGLPAVLFLIVEAIVHRDVFWAATFASIATVTGDTLASELGKIFGKRPIMITTLKPAKPGTNGAVSLPGEAFALLGAALIAPFSLPIATHKLAVAVAVVIGGFIGVNLDSIIGATLENRGLTNNNGTNFLAALLGGLAGALVFVVIGKTV